MEENVSTAERIVVDVSKVALQVRGRSPNVVKKRWQSRADELCVQAFEVVKLPFILDSGSCVANVCFTLDSEGGEVDGQCVWALPKLADDEVDIDGLVQRVDDGIEDAIFANVRLPLGIPKYFFPGLEY